MVTTYKYKLTYHKKLENALGLQHVNDFDSDLGRYVLRNVKGKPYISKFKRETYFLAFENAQNAYKRLLALDDIKYVKLHEGNFEVEEMSI